MYENELYRLIDNLFSILGLITLLITLVWLTYHYELKSLKIGGYMNLRLEEKKLTTPKLMAVNEQKFNIKLAKINKKNKGEIK